MLEARKPRKVGLLADTGDAYQVVAFDPERETFAPFGPPLPADGDEPVFAAIDATNGRAYVQLETRGSGERARVMVTDGVRWRTLVGRAVDAEIVPSEDLSLFFIATWTELGPDAPVEARVETFDGEVLYRSGPTPRRSAPQVVRVQPRGRWVLLSDQFELVLVPADGGTRPLGPAIRDVRVAFDRSIILNRDQILEWVDLFGAPFVPPAGFIADASSLSAYGFQLHQGQLSRLYEDRLEPIERVPSNIRVGTVAAAAPGLVITGNGRSLRATGQNGNTLLTYEPLPPESLPPDADLLVNAFSSPAHARLGGEAHAILVSIEMHAFAGDVILGDEYGFELWVFDDAGRNERHRLTTYGDLTRPEIAHLLGDSVYVVEGGALSRLRIDSLTSSTHAHEQPLLDVTLVQIPIGP